MMIVETIDCPKCPEGKIAVILEDNKVTSHGVCNRCEKILPPHDLQWYLDVFREEDNYYDLLAEQGIEEEFRENALLAEVMDEIIEFNNLVWLVFFDELYDLWQQEQAERLGDG